MLDELEKSLREFLSKSKLVVACVLWRILVNLYYEPLLQLMIHSYNKIITYINPIVHVNLLHFTAAAGLVDNCCDAEDVQVALTVIGDAVVVVMVVVVVVLGGVLIFCFETTNAFSITICKQS